jgi:glycosyltransferase involved in cell wall biosynthesis
MPASSSDKDDAPAIADPQRVAIVSHAHPSVSKGGAETAAFTLYEGLLALGHDAIFIAAVAESDRRKALRGSEREGLVYLPDDSFEPFFQLSSQNVGAEIEGIIRSRGSRIVNFHHFNFVGLDALRRVRAAPNLRMAFTFHEFLALCPHHGLMITPRGHRLCETPSPVACGACFPDRTRFDFHQRRRLFLEALSSFDQFVAPSYFLAERLCDWGLDQDRMFVVENGLAKTPERRPTGRSTFRRDWVFGFFGRIHPYKGVDVLLEAAQILQQARAAHVRIRIHGNLVQQSEAFCERLRAATASGAVEFAGAYDNRMVDRLMTECDYVVVPSRWWENSPLVIQEAFAAGRPVLCAGIGGMAEKVRAGEAGLHFAPGDAADLARCILEAADEQAHHRLVKGLPRTLDSAAMAKRYLEVFLTAARPRPTARIVETADAVQAITFG